MSNEDFIRLWRQVSVYMDNIKLTEKQKDFCVEQISYISRRNIVRKHLLLKGYILEVIIGFFRKILKLKQSERLIRLMNMSRREIMLKRGFKINYNVLKLVDEERRIILEVYNNKSGGWSGNWEMPSLYYDTVISNQYNVSSEKIKNKIVIDAGSNLGEFAIYCARLGAKKVYAFEPVTETFKILEKQIKINNLKGKVIPIKMALGDKNETLNINFGEIGDVGAHIGGELSSSSEIIKAIKLDDFIKKEKVGFIKMDVEGYEENILRGASKIIKRDKPILSFSAYHKPADKKILPMIVKGIRQDYKIRLLKRSFEEDFYCE